MSVHWRRRRRSGGQSEDEDSRSEFSEDESSPDEPRKKILCVEREPTASTSTTIQRVSSLLERSAYVTARHYPCYVLEKQDSLDDTLLKQIAFWAFPQEEEQVKIFAKLSMKSTDEWKKGEDLVNEDQVCDVCQVGFMLSADIKKDGMSISKVSLTFEKQRITSSHCALCPDYLWCHHVIAAILYRIRNAKELNSQVIPPLTETLFNLSRDQLQKLIQYAIAGEPGIMGNFFKKLAPLQNANSTESKSLGAPDPTFGIDKDGKSHWELSLEQLEQNLQEDLRYRENLKDYQDTYNIIDKKNSYMYTKYIQRVIDLVEKDEIEAAARVLSIITGKTWEAIKLNNRQWMVNDVSRTRRLFHDLERIWCCFIISFSGQICDDLVNTAIVLNRDASLISPSVQLPKSKWAELPSVKNHEDNYNISDSFPFYDPASLMFIDNPPEAYRILLDGVVSPNSIDYKERVSLMLLRLDALELWSSGDKPLQLCMLGSVILLKLMDMSKQYSVMSAYSSVEEREKISELKNYLKEVCTGPCLICYNLYEPCVANSLESKGCHSDSCLDNAAELINEIGIGMSPPLDEIFDLSQHINTMGMPINKDGESCIRPTSGDRNSDETVCVDEEILTKSEVTYCLIYVCFKIFETMQFPMLDVSLQELLLQATLRSLEMSRFRTVEPPSIIHIKEHNWLLCLEGKLFEYFISEPPPGLAKKVCDVYIDALTRFMNFYKGCLPLMLIELLVKRAEMHDFAALCLCTNAVCLSLNPLSVYTLSSQDLCPSCSDGTNHREILVKRFIHILNILLGRVRTAKTEEVELVTKVLDHLEILDDDEFLEHAMQSLKTYKPKISTTPQKLSCIRIILRCISRAVHKKDRGLYQSISHLMFNFLVALGKELVHQEELLEHVIPAWSDICCFYKGDKLKVLIEIMKEQLEQRGMPETKAFDMLFKYFEAKINHGDESFDLVKLFEVGSSNYGRAISMIIANASFYSTTVLLCIARYEQEHNVSTGFDMSVHLPVDLSFEVFSNTAFELIRLALVRSTNEEDMSDFTPNFSSNSDLTWLFECFTKCPLETVKKSSQFLQFLNFITDSTEMDAEALVRFFKVVENSAELLELCKEKLGPHLISAYKKQFHQDLLHCSYTAYNKIVLHMSYALFHCRKYVKNGGEMFGNVVLKHIRSSHRGKRKLVRMIEKEFGTNLMPDNGYSYMNSEN